MIVMMMMIIVVMMIMIMIELIVKLDLLLYVTRLMILDLLLYFVEIDVSATYNSCTSSTKITMTDYLHVSHEWYGVHRYLLYRCTVRRYNLPLRYIRRIHIPF
jgi:hypothetical protein